MARELRFIDPAFSCEVMVRGTSQALFQAAATDFDRLKGLRSLGLGGHLNEHGFHSRFHHLIGLQRLFEKLLLQPKGQGLPKQFLWSFWVRLCYAQVGHAAFSYDAEKAVLLACQLDASFRSKFETLFDPIFQTAAECVESAEDGSTPADVVRSWFRTLIDKNQWRRVHRWAAALKLVQSEKLLGILRSQVWKKEAGTPGYEHKTALRMLLEPKNEWEKATDRLSRLDFVVRDLTYTGRMAVVLDVDRLVAKANEDDHDWELVLSLYRYLADTLYAPPATQTEAAIFHRQLAKLLVKNKLGLTALFGLDSLTLGDEHLKEVMDRTEAGRQLFDPNLRTGWKTWTIDCDLTRWVPPVKVEQKLCPARKATSFLTAATDKGILCTVMEAPRHPKLAFAVRHRDTADRADTKDILGTCRTILNELYPRVEVGDVHQVLAESLCGHVIRHRLEDAVSRLADLGTASDATKSVAKYLGEKDGGQSAQDVPVKLYLEGLDQPIAQGDLHRKLVDLAISGSDELRDKLRFPLSKALRVLWAELFTWQHIHFPRSQIDGCERFRTETQSHLRDRILAGSEGRDFDLEIYTLLESLAQPEDHAFRISLPGVVLLDDGKEKVNEYDVVSFVLRQGGGVEVWIWGVTTEANITKKRTDDTAKIQKLKDLLGNRWDTDVRAVFNYVHVEGDRLVLEVDGRQERR